MVHESSSAPKSFAAPQGYVYKAAPSTCNAKVHQAAAAACFKLRVRSKAALPILKLHTIYILSWEQLGANRHNTTHKGTRSSKRSTIEHKKTAGAMLYWSGASTATPHALDLI